MSDRIREQWEALGASDPYWAVLTHADKKGGRWDKAAFFATGVAEIDGIEQRLAELAASPDRNLALDYGCGVGRLTRALAARFERVIGVDISQAMLDEARRANHEVANIEFVRGNGRDLAGVADASIDFLYSNIVLQHSSPDHQRSIIREFCRVMSPRGVLVFQTPSYANYRTVQGVLHAVLGNRVLNLARRFVYGKRGVMELHTLDKAEVLTLLQVGRMRLLEAQRYDSAGPAFVGHMYFTTRRAR